MDSSNSKKKAQVIEGPNLPKAIRLGLVLSALLLAK
jgi:hypothetical protein